MEPISPKLREQLLNKSGVSNQEIDEYQQLQSQRFRIDPDLPLSPEQRINVANREHRIGQLYNKLFAPG
jgi:hypothetical protein